MKERLITLACAMGALALFYAFFVPKPGDEEEAPSRPTTDEHRDNGYLGAVRWLEKSGVRVVKLRRRFDELENPGSELPRTGNLLVTTLPYRFGVRDEELPALRNWVADGNTLLVMAALGDTPDWTMPDGPGEGSNLVLDAHRITQIRFVSEQDARQEEEEKAEADEEQPPADGKTAAERAREALAAYYRPLEKPERMRMVPNGRHRLFEGVRECVAESEYGADDWRAEPQEGLIFTLAHEEPSGSEALWMRTNGRGTILVSTYASLFTNQLISEKDNARLFSNLVRQSLGPAGAVIFDDTHQGLSELYDAAAFFADERLHTTLWLFLALWLVWVLGATRLRAAHPPATAPRESTLTVAVGGYLVRAIRPSQAGLRICQHFFNDVHRRLGEREDGSPAWEWLERQPRVVPADLARLREFHATLAAGRRVDLRKVHDLTVQLQEQLQ